MTSLPVELFQEPEVLRRERWYVGCTMARHEKAVAEHLRQRGIDYLLPLYETVHRWNNGRHRVQLPLFPGYIFVHIPLNNRLRVLEVPGFAHLIAFGNLPVSIPDEDIASIGAALSSGRKVEPYEYLANGMKVEIVRGPMQGVTGLLLRRHGDFRVVLSVDLIMRSMTVEVDGADVVPLTASRNGVSSTLPPPPTLPA